MWMNRPAGVCGVPLGETAVCQAGTSLTHPQSNVTVPPRLGSNTFSTPAPAISFASSTMATTVAPVRLAMSTVSPRWSAWPWLRRITSGCISSAVAAAFGLPVRNGSVSTVAPPAFSSKQLCPRKRMSTAMARVLRRRVHQRVRQLIPDGHADEHAHPGVLLQEVAHGLHPLVRVRAAGRPEQLRVPRRAEPVGLRERLVEDALQLWRAGGDDPLRLLEALGIAQRLDRGIDLGVGVRAALGHVRAS